MEPRITLITLGVADLPRAVAFYRDGLGWPTTYHLSGRTHPDPAALDTAIREVLDRHATDLIVLAGYMKQVGPHTLNGFRGRVLNTHPALLPKFGGKGMYGLHVHRAVLAAGEAKTGASVHVVTEDYDAGPVVAQRDVPVEPADTPETLAERVQVGERSLLVEVLGRIADRHLRLPGRLLADGRES